MSSAWLREAEPDLAVEKILDAAEKAFVELGVSAASMGKIAEFAGCSRGTLYRYFENRHELHLAYVNRTALAIVERVRREVRKIDDPRERLTEGILFSIRQVRRRPGSAAWFAPGASEIAARMSRSSELIDTLTERFVSELLHASGREQGQRPRARWLVRTIVSLLTMPGASASEERSMVERFVVPPLLEP